MELFKVITLLVPSVVVLLFAVTDSVAEPNNDTEQAKQAQEQGTTTANITEQAPGQGTTAANITKEAQAQGTNSPATNIPKQAPTKGTNSTAANITVSGAGDIDEEDELSPEDEELEKSIAELQEKQCLLLLGDCWLWYQSTKPYLPEEQRLNTCIKRVQGFMVCDSVNDTSAQQAKDDAEQRRQVEEEAEVERQKKNALRKEKLEKRKLDLSSRRLMMKEAAEEARLARTKAKEDTQAPGTLPETTPESVEVIEGDGEGDEDDGTGDAGTK